MSVVRWHPAGTVQAALTESEIASIGEPRAFDFIQLGNERIPYTHAHPSMLYWRLGLCDNDKFECLALGNRLYKHINGLRTAAGYVHRSHSAAQHAQHAFVALAACRSFFAVCLIREIKKSTKTALPEDTRVLALISTSGSGKTRSLLELLCLRFGLFLVADTSGNGGAADFAQAVTCGTIDPDRRVFARQVAACVLARLLVLQQARARDWTPAQFLHIQLFDHGALRPPRLAI